MARTLLSGLHCDKCYPFVCLRWRKLEYKKVINELTKKTKNGDGIERHNMFETYLTSMTHKNLTRSFSTFVNRYSKQAFLSDVQQPHTLPDGSPSFKDFMGSKNNRFLNPEMASKNRIQPPTKVIPKNSFTEKKMKIIFFYP